jgi:hypothetical protein
MIKVALELVPADESSFTSPMHRVVMLPYVPQVEETMFFDGGIGEVISGALRELGGVFFAFVTLMDCPECGSFESEKQMLEKGWKRGTIWK